MNYLDELAAEIEQRIPSDLQARSYLKFPAHAGPGSRGLPACLTRLTRDAPGRSSPGGCCQDARSLRQ
jgi:hypothetical protein